MLIDGRSNKTRTTCANLNIITPLLLLLLLLDCNGAFLVTGTDNEPRWRGGQGRWLGENTAVEGKVRQVKWCADACTD